MGLPITAPLGVGRQIAQQAVIEIVTTGWRIKTACDNAVAKMQASGISADDVFGILQAGASQARHLGDLATTPELDAVARNIIPNYVGSLSADATATANAIQAAITWIVTNIPHDANGYVLVYKWNADGTQSSRIFTPVQTAGLAQALAAVGATIG